MLAPDREPYVGPRAFRRSEQELFFGRALETRNLSSLVLAHPIVLLYAASGAGKSSLINAGLIPLLEEVHGCEVLPPARVSGRPPTAIKDSDVANIYAFNVLSSWAGPSADPGDLVHVDIAAFLATRPHRKDETGEPVLRIAIFDQFEEIFTFAPEHWREREGFSAQLAAALEADPLLRAVIAMREEFLGQLPTYTPQLSESARTRFHLEPLGPEAARQAVEGPLGQTSRKIEPEASRALVEDLLKVRVTGARGKVVESTGRFVEPVQLQVACTKLWNDLPADVQTITPAHLKTFGDVNKALKQFYEDALDAASAKSAVPNDRLRLWVEHYLITPGGTRGMVYRGEERTGLEGEAIPNSAVDVLEEKHLIRVEVHAGGERWYELTHDRFVEPVKESNRAWKEDYSQRLLLRKRRRGEMLLGAIVILLFAYFGYFRPWYMEYQCADKPVNKLLDQYSDDAGRQSTLFEEAKSIRKNLRGVATCLLKLKKPDRLAELLAGAKRLIPFEYGAERWHSVVSAPRIAKGDRRSIQDGATDLGITLPRIERNQSWPIEVRYNHGRSRSVDENGLIYEWRTVAEWIASNWGIPLPATLKLNSEDNSVPLDYVKLVATGNRADIDIPSGTPPDVVLISEGDVPESLRPWFKANDARWQRPKFLENGGPWWWLPTWTQPIFDAENYTLGTREGAVAAAIGSALLAKPELMLNAHNVAYLLRRLKEAEPRSAPTVDEALSARGGIDGLVEDLRAIVGSGFPLTRLEYLLDSLAAYPKSQYPSERVAKLVIEEQATAAPIVTQLAGTDSAAPVKPLEEFTSLDDALPYQDTAGIIRIEPPLRVYLGQDLDGYLAPKGKLRPELLEELSNLRGELYKQFGIQAPRILFGSSTYDPAGWLAPNAFRIEMLNQSPSDADAKAIATPAPERAVKQFLDELRWRLFAGRTWLINADFVHKQLERNKEIETWLLAHYTLTDVKVLLRGIIAPTDAELEAYGQAGFDPLQHAGPGQSVRELDWLLASLVFWSQAYDRLDATQLVQGLRDTQARRLAHTETTAAPRPSAALLAGIEALERRDFPAAEQRFREALSENRNDAITAFASAYASRDSISTSSNLKKLAEVCAPFERPGLLHEHRVAITDEQRFEIEDFLAQRRDAIADPDRVRFEYCLLENYAANSYPIQMRSKLDLLTAPQYQARLEPNQKYALGYWTLELSGRSAVPPSDLTVAKASLVSAFKEWKNTEQDEADAANAIRELLDRYSDPPPWYMEMVQRLGELRPNNVDIAFSILRKFAESRNRTDISGTRDWFDRTQKRIEHSGLPQAIKFRFSSWSQYLAASAYLTEARRSVGQTSENAAQEAMNQLQTLIQSLRKDGQIGDKETPGAEAYSLLIDTYLFRGQIDEAKKVLDASHKDVLRESDALLSNRIQLSLLAGQVLEASQVAEDALQKAEKKLQEANKAAVQRQGIDRASQAQVEARSERDNALFLTALVQLLRDQPQAEKTALEFLDTNHSYRDYVRLMLYWYLAREKNDYQAKAYLEERWNDIHQESWKTRLADGDPRVWREQLIGYYLGKVNRDEIFAPLTSPEVFEASAFSRAGPYYIMRGEAYFYDALLQEARGTPGYAQGLEHVLEMGHADLYEYQMARYLRRGGN